MSSAPHQQSKLSWVDRYRPERLFYLLLVSVVLSFPVSLLTAFIAGGPATLALPQWSNIYVVHMSAAYPLPAIGIGLLAIALAIYGFRLDQRRQRMIAEQEKQSLLNETQGQIQPVHEIVQGVADQQKVQGAGIQQVIEQTAHIQHIVAQNSVPTVPLILVRDIKPATLNLGDEQSATFPYQNTIFPEVYAQATQVLLKSLSDERQRGLLVTGAPMAGKTRLAYQAMFELAPDWLTLTWTRGLTASAIPAPETLTNQRVILFLDDLQQYAEFEGGEERQLGGISYDLPLDRLYATLAQSAAQVVIVSTCRATDLSRAETTTELRWLFEKVQLVAIPFIPDERKDAVIGVLKATNVAMDYHDDDFDSTVGSLMLGLSRKREQYLALKTQRHPGYLVLRAMKLLNLAGVPIHSQERVRAMAVQAHRASMLSDEFTWGTTCEDLQERQFLTTTDTALIIRKDVYFDKVITDYPTQVRDALLQARRVFQKEADSEALIALGWTHNQRKETNDMLETSTLAVESAPDNARAHYAHGTALGYLKRTEEALAAFEQAITLDPTFANGWNNKGFMLDDLERLEEAVAAYDEAVRLNPHYARAWYNRGITLWKLKRYEEALVAYDEAIKLNSQNADAWYNKGIVLSKLKREDDALAAFEEALKTITLNPAVAAGWYNKGEMLSALNRRGEAVEAYDEAIQLNPQYFEAWYSKAYTFWNLRRYEEALASFDQALTFNSQNTDVWMNKGNLLFDLKRYEEAIVCYNHLLALDPQNIHAWNNKGAALNWLGHFEDALVSLEKALTLDPHYTFAWAHKGNALRGLHHYEDALACMEKALEIDPQYARAWFRKGTVLVQMERDDEALAAYDKAIELNPRDAETWYSKGALLCRQEQYEEATAAYDKALQIDAQLTEFHDEAMTAYDRAIQLNPQSAIALYNKGMALGTMKRYEEALAIFDKAIQLGAQFIDIWYSKGMLLHEMKRDEEAIAAFDEAIQLKPEYDRAWYSKGMALEQLERFEEALATYEEAIRLNPTNTSLWHHKGEVLKKLERYEDAADAYVEAIQINSTDLDAWNNLYKLLEKLGQHEDAQMALNTIKKLKAKSDNSPLSIGATPGFGRFMSPDMVDDEYLDTEIVILLHGTNLYNNPVYSYVKLIGSDLKRMFAAMQAGENFKPSDYGTIIASGMGQPSKEVLEQMKEEWNMIDVPLPEQPVPDIQPKSFDDESTKKS